MIQRATRLTGSWYENNISAFTLLEHSACYQQLQEKTDPSMVATAFLNMAYGRLEKRRKEAIIEYLGSSILVHGGESIREYLQPDEKRHWKKTTQKKHTDTRTAEIKAMIFWSPSSMRKWTDLSIRGYCSSMHKWPLKQVRRQGGM